MPLPIVAPTLFNAQGLAATVNEPHARAGNHFRINTHPLLGLPVAPFIIWRAVVEDERSLKLRNAVTFRDDGNRTVSAPFTLTRDRPITATITLTQNQTCIWARVIADPFGGPETGDGMVAEARISTMHGPAPTARRNSTPFAFNAPGIVEIRLTGGAAVVRVEWMEASDVPHAQFKPWSVLNLPHDGGPRYASIVSPVKHCIQRVFEQAPKRRPLQETSGAIAPSAAPLEPEQFEVKRVSSLVKPLDDTLNHLITDLSLPPLEQMASAPAFDETGVEIGSMNMHRLNSVYQAQFDPGTATFFGYKGYDAQFVEVESRLVFYWIEGYFRDFFPPPVSVTNLGNEADIALFDTMINALPSAHRIGDQHKLVSSIRPPIDAIPNIELDTVHLPELEAHSDYIGLGTLLVVDRQAPPLAPVAPRITHSEHIGWLPLIPPAAERETRIDLAGVDIGSLLASEKRIVPGSTPNFPLNKANDDGFHLPLVLGLNADDETLEPMDEPGTGFLSDRTAPAATLRYFVAQQDRFGRWSPWTSVLNAPGDRPRPPPPVIQADYQQPSDPAVAAGTLSGKAAVPQPEALAPGAFLLQGLSIEWTDLTNGVTQTRSVSIADPSRPSADLPFSLTAPGLNPTEQRQLRVVARWSDTDGQVSVDSEPVVLTLTDPRPPAQLVLPDTLLYSARPDVTGLSLVEHTWTPLAGQSNMAVYYTDENRLRAHLESVAATDPASTESSVLALITAAGDIAARATIYRNNPSLFGAHLFERLAGVVVDVGAGQKRFQHAVSGSLRVLNTYRLSAESASNARVELSTLPLLLFGVPNVDPPATPVLEVRPGDIVDNLGLYSARISISLVPGVTEAAAYRLRRSSLSSRDVLRMPVVEMGTMPAPDASGRQTASVLDEGPVQISATARLKPWVRYQWVAELQGAPAPGSGVGGTSVVAGKWSTPSESVSLILTPPSAPFAPVGLAASGTNTSAGSFIKVTLAFDHSHVLSGGEIGSYRVRAYRRQPGSVLQALPDVEVAGSGPFIISGLDTREPLDEVLTGTVYQVVIIDPLGRVSEPALTTLI